MEQEEKLHFPSCLWKPLPVTLNVPPDSCGNERITSGFATPGTGGVDRPFKALFRSSAFAWVFLERQLWSGPSGTGINPAAVGGLLRPCAARGWEGPFLWGFGVPAGSGNRSEGCRLALTFSSSLLSQRPGLLCIFHGGYDPERPPRGGRCGK